jgi:hypothetical protein
MHKSVEFNEMSPMGRSTIISKLYLYIYQLPCFINKVVTSVEKHDSTIQKSWLNQREWWNRLKFYGSLIWCWKQGLQNYLFVI